MSLPTICVNAGHDHFLAPPDAPDCIPLPVRVSNLGGLPRVHLDTAICMTFRPTFDSELAWDSYSCGEDEVRI